MPLPIKEFIERLSEVTDPPLLCELLGLSSQDILERFSDVLEDRIEVLREIYDLDFDDVMLYNREYDE